MADYFLNRDKYQDDSFEKRMEAELDRYDYNPALNEYSFDSEPNNHLPRWGSIIPPSI
jgi:hypothetical protein